MDAVRHSHLTHTSLTCRAGRTSATASSRACLHGSTPKSKEMSKSVDHTRVAWTAHRCRPPRLATPRSARTHAMDRHTAPREGEHGGDGELSGRQRGKARHLCVGTEPHAIRHDEESRAAHGRARQRARVSSAPVNQRRGGTCRSAGRPYSLFGCDLDVDAVDVLLGLREQRVLAARTRLVALGRLAAQLQNIGQWVGRETGVLCSGTAQKWVSTRGKHSSTAASPRPRTQNTPRTDLCAARLRW